MNIAVVTGASSGLGREFVKQISERYQTIDEIWVLARRKDRLLELKNDIKNITVRPIACDVTNDGDLEQYVNLLKVHSPSVRILVNAAGYGMIGKFHELNDGDNVGMCKVNCVALTRMIDISLPYMNKRKANIINIASAAAFLPQPSFAVYAATKSYVLSLSTALNKELKEQNITVTAVCPGPVETEFFDIAEKYNSVKIYKKLFRAKAYDVVKQALEDAYHDSHISVYGFTMKAFRIVAKIVPHNFAMKFIN